MSWKTSENITFHHDEILRISCIECKHETNHKVLVSANVNRTSEEHNEWDEFINSFTEWEKYQVAQCLGCNSILFREELTNDNHYPNSPVINIYPNPEQRFSIEHIDLLPRNDIKSIYAETLKAINSNQPILAGIGIRTVLDAITQEQKTRGNDLKEKIDNLVDKGVITGHEAETLHKLRDIGNKATHATIAYSNDELSVAMDVIEHLLQKIYILSYNVSQHLASPIK